MSKRRAHRFHELHQTGNTVVFVLDKTSSGRVERTMEQAECEECEETGRSDGIQAEQISYAYWFENHGIEILCLENVPEQ